MTWKKEVKIEAPDYLDFCLRTSLYRNWPVLVMTMLFVWAFTGYFGGHDVWYVAVGVGFLFAVGYGILVGGLFYVATIYMAKRSYSKRNLEAVRIQVEINEHGMVQTMGPQTATFAWKDFRKVLRSPYGFYFYVTSTQALLLGLHQCSDQERQTLIAILEQYAPLPKKK